MLETDCVRYVGETLAVRTARIASVDAVWAPPDVLSPRATEDP
jgi:hypothetical protein